MQNTNRNMRRVWTLASLFLYGAFAFSSPTSATGPQKPALVFAPTNPSMVEPALREALKNSQGISVVHFWAPWCGNCKNELRPDGWAAFVKDHPNINFYFVAIYNGGENGVRELASAGIQPNEHVVVTADPNPRRGEGKTERFLSLPISWIPSTWIFKNGTLIAALNYGEIRFPILNQLVEDADAKW